MTFSLHRTTGVIALIVTMASVLSTSYPSFAADATDDLKQIEYRYYFRGRYQQAIEALQTYLARVDLAPAETLRAREVLAASYVLGGAPAMGKEVFATVIAADPAYPGPDPSVFKLEVVNAYAEARAEYTARTLKTIPAQDPSLATAGEPATAQDDEGKPIYKQWWLYAGVAAALIAVGVAVGGGGDDPAAAPASGTVTVGVVVH